MIKKTKRIYRLADISIEKFIIPYHLSLCANPSTKNKSILTEKYTHLIHSIIRRIISSDDHEAVMNSEILRSLYDNEYCTMVTTLHDIGIFTRNYYEIGKRSYGFRFMTSRIKYTITYEYPTYLQKYEDKLDELLYSIHEGEDLLAAQSMGEDFHKDYMSSLRLVKMPYYKLAEEFISLHHFPSQEKRDFYAQTIEDYTNYKNPHIKVDQNNRIYHIMTNTPRTLKPYLNIKFACDIHNSHPLLFASLIYDYHGVPLYLRQVINSILDEISIIKDNNSLYISIPPISENTSDQPHPYSNLPLTLPSNTNTTSNNIPQYVYGFVCNRLINKELIIQENANICKPINYDELFFILLVSKGVFWDYIVPRQICDQNGLTRSDVKVTMFNEVFYSNKKGIAWKPYAKIFKSVFPNVYALVDDLKFVQPHIDQSPAEWISSEMMRLESALFWDILKRLYKKRYRVINIHDAIVVLDVKANRKCTVEEVCEIMKQVYYEKGLLPDLSVDWYGEDHALECVEREKTVRDLTQVYMREQRHNASNGDPDSIVFLRRYEKGEVELLLGPDQNSLKQHPLKPKCKRNQMQKKNRKSVQKPTKHNTVIPVS